MSLLRPDMQKPAQDGNPAETFHRRPAVKQRYGNPSDSTLYRWIDEKRFPPPEKLGPNFVAWRESTLREYDEDPQGWASRNQEAGE